MEVLKKLGFTQGLGESNKDINLEKLNGILPKMFEPYLKQLAKGDKIEPVCFESNLPN